jgi:hypothetical protein
MLLFINIHVKQHSVTIFRHYKQENVTIYIKYTNKALLLFIVTSSAAFGQLPIYTWTGDIILSETGYDISMLYSL